MTMASMDEIQRELDRALGEDVRQTEINDRVGASGAKATVSPFSAKERSAQIVPRAFSNTAQGALDQAAALLKEVMEGADSIIRAEQIIKDAAGKLADKLIEARKLIQSAKDRL